MQRDWKTITATALAVGFPALAVIAWQWARAGALQRELAEARALAAAGAGASTAGFGHHGQRGGDGGAASTRGAEADIAEALDIPEAPLREANLREAGFNAAARDLEAAFAALDAMEDGPDRNEFLRGVFSALAARREAGDVLALVNALEEQEDRAAALRSVVATWTGGRSTNDPRVEDLTGRFGLEAGLGMVLGSDEAYRPALGEAWMAAFGDSDGRAAMFGTFATKHLPDNPEAALAMGEHFGGFERELFLRVLADSWARSDVAAAWEWVSSGVKGGDAASSWLISELMPDLVAAGGDAADEALAALADPDHRGMAVASIAKATAYREGTAAAVGWADGLADAGERELAYRAIGETAPRGIGAALSAHDGFIEVTQLIPGGTASADGRIQAGDRIVAVDPGVGDFELVYGQPLERVLKLITGEPGTGVRLRVARDDGSGNWIDQVVELQRQQLVLPGSEGIVRGE